MSRLTSNIPVKRSAATKTSARQDRVLRESETGSEGDLAANRPVRDGQIRAGQNGHGLGEDDRFLTVTELAKELGVTARALRFYEDKNLITPRRVANTRVYTNRERARMILILRGKRLGFSLREIKDYLDLYDADPVHLTQTRALLKKIAIRTKHLEDQRLAVDQALKGLKELEVDALAVLEKARREIPEGPAPSAGSGQGTSREQHTFIPSAAPVSAASAADYEEPHI